MPGPHRGRQPAAERVHPRDGRRGAAPGARRRSRAGRRPRPRAAARRPDLDQGPDRHRAARRRRPRRACATATSPTRRAGHRAPAGGRRRLHRQDEPARVRVRYDQRGLRVRPGAQSARSGAIARRIERRLRRQRRRRHGAGVASAPTRADRSGFPPRPAASSDSSRPTARCRPTTSSRCRARSITSVRSRGAWRTRGWCTTCSSATPRRGPLAAAPVRGCGSRFCPASSATCWTTRCGRGSTRRSTRLREGGARVHEVVIRHAEQAAPIYLHIVLAEAAEYHARTIDSGRSATRRPSGRLEMGRYVLAEDYVRAMSGRELLAAKWTRRWPTATRSRCRRSRFRRPDWRGVGIEAGHVSRCARDAAHDAAVQPDRPSGDLDAVRARQGRLPCGLQMVGAPARPRRCCGWRSPANRRCPPAPFAVVSGFSRTVINPWPDRRTGGSMKLLLALASSFTMAIRRPRTRPPGAFRPPCTSSATTRSRRR